MLKQTDTYKKPITIIFPEMVARVYLPILSPEERETRLKALHRATANMFEGVKK